MSFIGYISVLFAWRAVTIKVRLYSVAVHHASEMPPVWLFSIVTVYTLLKPYRRINQLEQAHPISPRAPLQGAATWQI